MKCNKASVRKAYKKAKGVARLSWLEAPQLATKILDF